MSRKFCPTGHILGTNHDNRYFRGQLLGHNGFLNLFNNFQDALKGPGSTEIRICFIKKLQDAMPVGEDWTRKWKLWKIYHRPFFQKVQYWYHSKEILYLNFRMKNDFVTEIGLKKFAQRKKTALSKADFSRKVSSSENFKRSFYLINVKIDQCCLGPFF